MSDLIGKRRVLRKIDGLESDASRVYVVQR
jgi:hypothetical protein